MTELNLESYGISRSEKIVWRFPEQAKDVLENIKSKSLRKFLRNAKQALATNSIRYEYKVLSDQEFIDWLTYYHEKMTENGYQILATTEWLAKKRAAGLTVEGMFFYKADKLVGSGIFTKNQDEKATFAFKASDRIELSSDANSSLGAVIDYLFLEEMVQKHVKIISAGRSKNAFGVLNNFGYLDYKLRFGYQPSVDPQSPLLLSVPLNEQGVILFYGLKENALALYEFKPKGLEIKFEQARFATPELPFIVIEY